MQNNGVKPTKWVLFLIFFTSVITLNSKKTVSYSHHTKHEQAPFRIIAHLHILSQTLSIT